MSKLLFEHDIIHIYLKFKSIVSRLIFCGLKDIIFEVMGNSGSKKAAKEQQKKSEIREEHVVSAKKMDTPVDKIHRFKNGNIYIGDCVDNKANGEGVLITASGDRYEGTWVDGKRHGKGCYLSSTG